MTRAHVTFRLPDGTVADLASDGLIGRSSACALRLDDARVSSVHAELSWRSPGFVLIARGGRLVVGGRGTREVIVEPGLEVELAPGLGLAVAAIAPGDAPPVPDTEGRERLSFVVTEETVKVTGPATTTSVVIGGVGARILALLLERPAGVAWDAIAEAAWPEEGALRRDTREGRARPGARWTDIDERRFRNRWDQQLATLRKQLSTFRGGTLLVAQRGVVELGLKPTDAVEPGTSRASRTPNVNTAAEGSDE